MLYPSVTSSLSLMSGLGKVSSIHKSNPCKDKLKANSFTLEGVNFFFLPTNLSGCVTTISTS